MNSLKPYYIRALHEWISDNNYTPLILVSSNCADLQIPAGIDEDGKAILNISFSATQNLQLINEGIMFDARFSGVSQSLYIPVDAVLAIYARENGKGMMFSDDEDALPEPEPPKPTNKEPVKIKKEANKSFLKVVK